MMMTPATRLSQCSPKLYKAMSQSVRTCSQCTATTSAGTQCRKRTCRGPVCWQHAQQQHGLRVKPSQIQNAGFGLYATKRLAKNARVASYTGEHRTRNQIAQKYGTDTGQYVLCRSRTTRSLHQVHRDRRGGSRPGRPQGRLKSTQRETLLKKRVSRCDHPHPHHTTLLATNSCVGGCPGFVFC